MVFNTPPAHGLTLMMARLLVSILLCLLLGTASSSLAGEAEGANFDPSDDPMSQVDAVLERASAAGKLALIILGANWCHDSRGLAARMDKRRLRKVLERDYETALIDVGFLEHGRDVVQRFGPAHYYATPTVLIVDPADGRLVNAHDRHQWGAADSLSMDVSVAYFEAMAQRPAGPADPEGPEWDRLVEALTAFEAEHAERVADGYARVGPLLKAHKAGNTPARFRDQWDELARYRNALAWDVQRLWQEARDRVAAGETAIELSWPRYAPMSWETGTD